MSSSDRKPYLTATVLDQELLDACHDNLVCQLEMIVEIDSPGGTVYVSDRAKYVGDTYYAARLKFPDIARTIGEWLSPTLEFSTIKLELNNADGYFNYFLPAGTDFAGWIDREVLVKVGLAEQAGTYKTIFRGRITPVGGFGRSVKSISIVARDDFERMKAKFPTEFLSADEFPNIEDQFVGTLKPVVYGDWTQAPLGEFDAAIPAFPVNGADPGALDGSVDLQLFVAGHDLSNLLANGVRIVRSQQVYAFDPADITVGAGNRTLTIAQSATTGISAIDGGGFLYSPSDRFYVRCQGKNLPGYSDNIVSQAKDVLETFGLVAGGDFHSSWATYRDKAAPAQSAISTFRARAHIQEQQEAITYALSLLEQVRLEAFVDRDLKLRITSTHFEDFQAAPAFTLRNYDVERGAFEPRQDVRHNFNRVQGFYNRLPVPKDNNNKTAFFRNNAAIALAQGKVIEKGLVFPNLYDEATVEYQTQEVLKLSSSYFETIEATITWRGLLLDLGDFVGVDVNIGASEFDRVPAMVREIGYEAKGLRLPVKLWSFQMTPFPGYTPGYPGTVGGSTATITKE